MTAVGSSTSTYPPARRIESTYTGLGACESSSSRPRGVQARGVWLFCRTAMVIIVSFREVE